MSETPQTQRSTQHQNHQQSTSTTSSTATTRFPSRNFKKHVFDDIYPFFGFNQGLFYGQDKVMLMSTNYVKFIDGTDYEYTVIDKKFDGNVSSIQISPDFNYIAINVDDQKGANMYIYDAKDINCLIREFSTTILAEQICISLTNETILLLTTLENKKSATVALYGFEGTFLSETTISPNEISSNEIDELEFQVSYCPADETIICVVSHNICYLMRATTNVINTFSQINFTDMTCHTWADDVTLAFGTINGQIRLYRETQPLDIIDLKSVKNNFFDEDNNYDQMKVTVMYANDQYLLVYLQIGLIFIFPAGDLNERWKHARIIVIDSLKSLTSCIFLHIDQPNKNILYGDLESCWMCNIQYSEAICENGMRMISSKCSKSIKQISYDTVSKRLAIYDSDGFVLISNIKTKRILSYKLIDDIIGLTLKINGNKIMIAKDDLVYQYSILLHELIEEKIVFNFNEKIQKFVANQTLDLIAIVNASKLTILDTTTFNIIHEIFLESKQDIIQLKWSMNSEFLTILAKKDTLYLINVENGQIIWNHEYKLKFFVDVSIYNEIIFALGTKFTVARYDNKKELESMNVHYETVSFNSTTTTIVTTFDSFYYGTKMGSILRVEANNIENIQLIKILNNSGISTLDWIKSENLLISGHDDGSIFIINLNDTDNVDEIEKNQINDESKHQVDLPSIQEDVILCRFNDFERNKFLAKELRVERNLIREQCKRVFDEYKMKKEEEIRQFNETLDANTKAMNDKIKTMQDKFEAKEASNEQLLSKLKEDFKTNITEQKDYYEKMINDQIKASLAKYKENEDNIIKISENFDEKIKENELQFGKEKQRLEDELLEYKKLSNDFRKELFDIKSLYRLLQQNNFDEQQKHLIMIQKFKDEANEEKKLMNSIIKDLKATILIIENEKQAEVQNVRQQKIRLEALSDELTENQNLFDQKNLQIEKLQERVNILEKENNNQDKMIQKLNQKLSIVNAEIEHEKKQKKGAELRLKTFEAMVEAMSSEIYDSKKLEKNALAMLAYFKSPNQLLQHTKPHITRKRR